MGKNNRQRRAAKQRKRRRQPRTLADAPESRRARNQSYDPPPDPMAVFEEALRAHGMLGPVLADEIVDRLASLPANRFARDLQRRLEGLVAEKWGVGWQPAILHRAVQREVGRSAANLLAWVVAAESAGYEVLGRKVAPEWMHQLVAIEARRRFSDDEPYLLQFGDDWADTLRAAVALVVLLLRLPDLPVLDPPPSTWREGMVTTSRSSLPTEVLEKVRALLAKAESTSFDAEAEAFTAKAQELMTRHRIDRAVLESAEADDEPIGRRVFIDDPYAEAKALLLQVVCAANGAHSVWTKPVGFSTVFALGHELDIVEDLFTSLLVQASAALQREGSKTDRLGRSRTTRFRRSFLVAFANRIGHRLQEAADVAVTDAEAETGRSLVPVLASRAVAAQEAAFDAFPALGDFSPTATDGEGWHAGTLFGDRADLGVGAEVTDRAVS